MALKFYPNDPLYRVICIWSHVHKLIVSFSMGLGFGYLAFWKTWWASLLGLCLFWGLEACAPNLFRPAIQSIGLFDTQCWSHFHKLLKSLFVGPIPWTLAYWKAPQPTFSNQSLDWTSKPFGGPHRGLYFVLFDPLACVVLWIAYLCLWLISKYLFSRFGLFFMHLIWL